MEHVNKKSILNICLLIVIAVIDSSSTVEFDYKNVDSWVQINPQCGGQRQSPVSLEESQFDNSDSDAAFFVANTDKKPLSAKLMNDGHTLKVNFEWDENQTPLITGGILGETVYVFDSLHFHWSRRFDNGSEHIIFGYPAALEAHFVHYNLNYGSVANALNYDDGLAVVGSQFDTSLQRRRRESEANSDSSMSLVSEPSPALSIVIDNVESVSTPGSSVDIEPFTIKDLRPVQTNSTYVTYLGSLTTPPCTENVLWLLSTYPYQVSEDQLKILQSTVELNHGDDHNNRDVQPMNDRKFSLLLAFPKSTD